MEPVIALAAVLICVVIASIPLFIFRSFLKQSQKDKTMKVWNLIGVESVIDVGLEPPELVKDPVYVFVDAAMARRNRKSLEYLAALSFRYELAAHRSDFKYVEGPMSMLKHVKTMVLVICEDRKETKVIRNLQFEPLDELIKEIRKHL